MMRNAKPKHINITPSMRKTLREARLSRESKMVSSLITGRGAGDDDNRQVGEALFDFEMQLDTAYPVEDAGSSIGALFQALDRYCSAVRLRKKVLDLKCASRQFCNRKDV